MQLPKGRIFGFSKKFLLLLFLVLAVGIFLRTYNFHDWLRFSHDQARDAKIISDALDGKQSLPLLGPNAGSSSFNLGPMYYYFSYISAKIFGKNPVAMAYPSLFFSILAIPLFFLFLREYFNRNLSLALTTVMSVSYFMVINSRFSSNPNLMPFFLILYLYAALQILNYQKKKDWLWIILLGISLGIGINMHTIFLVVMPLVTLCVFIYLGKKKYPDIWKKLAVIILIILALNTSQLTYEFNSHWKNTNNFLSGFQDNSKQSANLANGTLLISACQIQANAYIVSSLQDDISCENILHLPKISQTGRFFYALEFLFSFIFSLVGYFLLWRRFKRSIDVKKKNFLGLIVLLNIITFLILIPIANMMAMGYFIFIFLIPFILLGLITETLQERYSLKGKWIAIGIIAALIIFSLVRDEIGAQSYLDGSANNSENSTLGEVEQMTQYILTNSKDSSKVYFSGDSANGLRFYRPVSYFLGEAGINSNFLTDIKKINKKNLLYYIGENESSKITSDEIIPSFRIISSQNFSNQTVFILKK